MILLTDERLQDVLDYMRDDIANCLFLYGNIVRYGIEDPNVTVWFSEKDGDITAVLLKYFSGSHLYSKNLDYDLDDVVEKLKEIDVDRFSSQREVIEALLPFFEDEYIEGYGGVFKYTNYREMKSPVAIEKANVEDADAIEELLMSNETYAKSYKPGDLARQQKNLIETGIGRSYIIRDGNRIIAHASVILETDFYAVTGLALVHDDFRNTLYGSFMDSFMINDLAKEGKDLYGRIAEGRRMDGFIRMGNKVQAYYGKLTRKSCDKE